MNGSISIDAITFKNGTKIKLKENAIVLFVGANNSGKSLTLREIYDSVINHNNQLHKKIIEEVTTTKNGKLDELFSFLEPRLNHQSGQYTEPALPDRGNSSYPKAYFENWWTQDKPPGHFGPLEKFFLKLLDTTNRLSLVHPPNSLNFTSQHPSHPIHVIKLDEKLELEFSKLFKKAFKEDLIVNHGAGSVIPLHVGKRPESTRENDRVSQSYLTELNKLGQLQHQGDGMKSFTGVLLSIFAENFSINIIDEPEAFLHPPQARLLGEMVAKNLHTGKQLFIATHSEHFLKGLVENSKERLVIIRLDRQGNVAQPTVLDDTELTTLWKDPILKHSNILDGLFHSKVVLCESDSDSRFFSVLASTIIDNEGLDALDLHFIQSGGKHKFPTVARAIKKMNVPLTVIADFDLLNNENPLRELYENMGGEWTDIQKDFKIIKSDVDAKKPELDTTDFKKEIQKILDQISGPTVTGQDFKNLENTTKKASAWANAKKMGRNMLSPGDSVQAFDRVQARLKQVGIAIIPIGEIEAFDKSVGNHGTKWVNEVLEKDIYHSPDLSTARDFVRANILEVNP